MLTLYVRNGCPFCEIVLAKIKYLDLKIELKDIADEEVTQELIARGGKKQVPYFTDSDRNVEMYESHDINMYLSDNYGATSSEGGIKEESNSPKVCTLE